MLLRSFIDLNVAAARRLDDRLLGQAWCGSAVGVFSDQVLPALLQPGLHVWDVGCGSKPSVAPDMKRARGITITGLDNDPHELAMMDPGSCDQVVVADLCLFRGESTADLVICRTVLEHVPDTEQAFAGLVSIVRPGGTLAICVPCRNALFARLNLILPQSLKERLLYAIWPHKADGHEGFPAFYHDCTPGGVLALARLHGLEITECRTCWWSSYFTFLLPLWAAWRVWQACAYAIAGEQACEGFIIVARKRT